MAAQRVLEIVDVALAGSEHENVARTTVVRGMDHQFGAGARHRGGHVHVRVARIAAVPAIRARPTAPRNPRRRHRARFETRHGTHQRGAVPNGSYTICTGYVRPDTSMTGTFVCSACSKCSWNFTESIVADVMTSFRSRRLGSSAVR